ncbi:MAG: hypothetical protein ABFR97_05465 [Thermodesulfobacteriota bacterium]
MKDQDFSQLHRAQEEIAKDLTAFFESDDFSHCRFVVNEFDLFTLFLVSAAWLASGDDSRQAPLVAFHKAHLLAMVEGIMAGQLDEVDSERQETLVTMVGNIAETRLRDYFSLLQKAKEQDAHLRFSTICDAFLVNFFNYDDPQILARITPLVQELFHQAQQSLAPSSSEAQP